VKRSTDCILTTHAGSLARPDDLIALSQAAVESGDSHAARARDQRLETAVLEVVQRQQELGIAVINDGEYGKAARGRVDYGPWLSYAYGRLGGWEASSAELPPGGASVESLIVRGQTRRDRARFEDFYRDEITTVVFAASRTQQLAFTGPVTYRGQAAVQRDIANLKAAVAQTGVEEAFMTSVAPGSFARGQNHYYPTEEEFLYAIGEAMRTEYQAIVDAGFVLQLDDPGLPDSWDAADASVTLADYRRYAKVCVGALNHALRGLPPDRLRYHICWGSWHGPHTTDLPLRDVVDLLLDVEVGGYSVEGGNVRHEHEWKVWQDVRLPEDRVLIPGVVSHATNVVEHPEVVADRIIQYARVVGRERVIAGTDCGLGGRIHPSLVWAKLAVLQEGAALATRQLWG
jgi:5-methyltetrahydropteroyltriglutamate--homocysteine methyltransferase